MKYIYEIFLKSIQFCYNENIENRLTSVITLLNMGFTSVYQLGRAGRGNGGEWETYNLDTENH